MTDRNLYKGEHNDLRISPTPDPTIIEVEVFNRYDRRGLWIEAPASKVRSMLAAATRDDTVPDSPDLADGAVTCAAIEKEVEADPRSGAGLAKHFRDSRDWWRVRAEKAEQERDEARRERDSWRSQVPLADWEKELVQATEQPRPLTADDITDEAKQRAVDAWWEWKANGAVLVSNLIEMILTAALTEPPARPEGAKEIEAVLSESPLGPEAVRGSLADFLASRGVRVEGSETPKNWA